MARTIRMRVMKRTDTYSFLIHNQVRRFCMLGFYPERIAKLPGMPSAETIRKWNTNENWDDEFKRIAKKTQEKRIDRLSDELAKMDARQLRRLMKVYKKVDIHLGEDIVPNAQELLFVTKALETAIKNERLIRGQATERSESSQDVNIGWKEIIYASASRQTSEYEIQEDGGDFQSSDGTFSELPKEIQE